MSNSWIPVTGRRRERQTSSLLLRVLLVALGAFVLWESAVTIVWDIQTEKMIDRIVTESRELTDEQEKSQVREKIDEILKRDNPYSLWR